MSDSLKKDLALFNLIVEELLKEEKKNPVSSLINAEDLHDKVDFSLSEQACINQKFTQALKDLVLKTPKTATNRFFNQLWGGRNSKA
ncbi:MAG: cysteine synthase, partial [Bacteroidota bacterium]|nr:cysteine synthase [Bacteroidota bacterium]